MNFKGPRFGQSLDVGNSRLDVPRVHGENQSPQGSGRREVTELGCCFSLSSSGGEGWGEEAVSSSRPTVHWQDGVRGNRMYSDPAYQTNPSNSRTLLAEPQGSLPDWGSGGCAGGLAHGPLHSLVQVFKWAFADVLMRTLAQHFQDRVVVMVQAGVEDNRDVRLIAL